MSQAAAFGKGTNYYLKIAIETKVLTPSPFLFLVIIVSTLSGARGLLWSARRVCLHWREGACAVGSHTKSESVLTHETVLQDEYKSMAIDEFPQLEKPFLGDRIQMEKKWVSEVPKTKV